MGYDFVWSHVAFPEVDIPAWQSYSPILNDIKSSFGSKDGNYLRSCVRVFGLTGTGSHDIWGPEHTHLWVSEKAPANVLSTYKGTFSYGEPRRLIDDISSMRRSVATFLGLFWNRASAEYPKDAVGYGTHSHLCV